MAAEVETMAYFGETPWHGMGSVLSESDRTNWELVCEKSGLNWEVEKVPLFTRETVVNNGIEDSYNLPVDDQFLVRRQTDKQQYGVLGNNFTILQNRDAFKWFQPWIESGLAKFETAGSLKQGAIVWAMAEIVGLQADVVPGDTITQRILLSNSHNGVQAVRGGFVQDRVVCRNTLNSAHNSKASKLLRVKHSRHLADNMLTLQRSMDVVRQEFSANMEVYRKLARTGFYRDDVVKLVKKIVLDNDGSEKLSTRSENILEEILDSVRNSPGADAAPNTAWSAYNGVNYYLLYQSGTKVDKSNRLYSAWFGTNKNKDQNLLNALVDMSA